MLDAPRQFQQTARIPAPAVEFGLRFGLEPKDREVVQAAAALYPRMVSLAPEERASVARLMHAARAIPGSGVQ